MLEDITDKVKKIWDKWDLRVLILISLSLQALLILFATFRKRSASKWVISVIWLAYLLADWVAAVCVGLISNNQGGTTSPKSKDNPDLIALWAPFLLLHLGGPDTITSFSLEDNELWLRHLLGLLLQVAAAIYVFFQNFHHNKVGVPIALVLIAGTIKYAERTRALYLSSLDHFGDSLGRKPNPGPEYERVQHIYNAIRSAHLPALVKMERGINKGSRGINLNEDKLVDMDPRSVLRYAFSFFETFKGLIPGLRLSSEERQVSRDFFLNRTAHDAFKLVEIELSLIYEVLHTKVAVVRTREGFILRMITTGSVIIAFSLFASVDKEGFDEFDVHVTYALFIGALILDTISVFKLMFYDRTVVVMENYCSNSIATRVIAKKRWSEVVYQFDFINYCLNGYTNWVENVTRIFWIWDLFDKFNISRQSTQKGVDEDLKKFIFKELRNKSLIADDAKTMAELCSSRGFFSLERTCPKLSWSISDFEYTESLLIWHIATQLCYNKAIEATVLADGIQRKPIAKLLSDYSLYLLVMEPSITAPVSGNWIFYFQDTCAEAKRFFKKHKLTLHPDACEKILSVNPAIKPGAVKGDLSKSVLFDACILANELLRLTVEERWEVMSRVWLEILCYAAVNCRANVHAQQPSKGGELITFIWLLMNHFGLGNQFFEANVARIKFIVRK